MKRKVFSLIFISVAVLLLTVSCEKSDPGVNNKELPAPVKIDLRGAEIDMPESDRAFAFEFFANVFNEEVAGDDRNFMVSPLSLSMALAMTWNGADGETKEAMQKTLRLDGYSDKEVNEYYKKLREGLLKTDPSTKLSIANSIWTNRQIKIKDEFVKLNKEYFNSTVESVDFADASTVRRMNKWAADNTNDLIDHVIDYTDPAAVMYLMNAIYFKGVWASKFDKGDTKKRSFYPEKGGSQKVDMMHQKEEFYYVENDLLQMVELPYGNEAFNMKVLLPKEGKTIANITAELQKKNYWSKLIGDLGLSEVDLYLPKFKTEYSKRLNDALAKMGMGVAFNPVTADFSRMSDRDAFISFVDQFTYISTDEVGTEAAAVTVVGMLEASLPKPPRTVTFNANRPFIYLIEEISTGSILFMGAVKDFE